MQNWFFFVVILLRRSALVLLQIFVSKITIWRRQQIRELDCRFRRTSRRRSGPTAHTAGSTHSRYRSSTPGQRRFHRLMTAYKIWNENWTYEPRQCIGGNGKEIWLTTRIRTRMNVECSHRVHSFVSKTTIVLRVGRTTTRTAFYTTLSDPAHKEINVMQTDHRLKYVLSNVNRLYTFYRSWRSYSWLTWR